MELKTILSIISIVINFLGLVLRILEFLRNKKDRS